jgi:D-lactate dehydrogenase (cytochrome)
MAEHSTPHQARAMAFERPGEAAVAVVRDALASLLGERAVTGHALREQHSRGEGVAAAALPDVVAFPETNEEVAAILALCHAQRVPVIPYGAGSSLEGQLVAVHGGVSIDLSRFDRMLSLSAESMDCRVQAGVSREALNVHVRDTGLFFSVDPGANATIGGMAATRASGTNTVRYGTMRENVLGLTVVTPHGEVMHTGSRARKSSAGLDLTHLYIGSEGTLGVITEVQVRLHPVPESIVAAVCQFADLEGAVNAAVAAMQSGLRVARIELLDALRMRACIAYSKLDYEPRPTLFLEFHGSTSGAREDAEAMQSVAADFGGSRFEFATRLEDRNRLWKARHNAYHAAMAMAPGKRNMATDVCVPISELAACLLETEADVAASGLLAPIVGHVGDGNFHLGILHDPGDAEELARAEALAFRVTRRAIAMGGTCSGEHGIGLHKIVHLETEHGHGVEVMRQIKRALDPHGIMNPGKLYPA